MSLQPHPPAHRWSSTLADPVSIAWGGSGRAADVVTEFFRAADRWPNRTAVLYNDRAFTYQQLAHRVLSTSHRYRACRPDSETPGFVGVLVSHHPAVIEHMLGILHAGDCYCPIDCALPDARKQALADAVGIDQVFALDGSAHTGRADGGLRVVDLASCQVPVDGTATRSPGACGAPAYVLCTSGSTGAPKPVAVSRGALTATVGALRRLFGLTPRDRVLQFASLAWDTCLEEILPALTSGAALVFDDAAHSVAFAPFLRMLAERKVTVLDLPTAFWHELVLYLHEEAMTLPRSVRLVVIGGERVDPTRLRQWRDLDTGAVRLLNTYGCTETTMITHAVQLDGPETEEMIAFGAEAPLGRSLAHVLEHVDDRGQLLISGPAVASGYLGMPEATDSGFPVEDHGTGPARWFHTGDIVEPGPAGLLYARGRADEQLKILGVRVHPAEVEAQLTSHPAVAGAVVVGQRRLGRTSLVAYVVAPPEIGQAELKRYLRERLPNQFVPSRITFVDALSYTTSGKVDRPGTQRAALESATTGTATTGTGTTAGAGTRESSK